MPDEFGTMKEIGKVFGVSSHVVGKRLKELGWRRKDGKPSHEAFACGLVQRKWTEDGEHYLWAWSIARTVPILEQAGLCRK